MIFDYRNMKKHCKQYTARDNDGSFEFSLESKKEGIVKRFLPFCFSTLMKTAVQTLRHEMPGKVFMVIFLPDML